MERQHLQWLGGLLKQALERKIVEGQMIYVYTVPSNDGTTNIVGPDGNLQLTVMI